MIRTRSLACLLVATLCVLPAFALDDDMHAHHHDANEKLGKVSFPISCAPASQKAFERGVALMHSFGYEEAEAQFTEITKKDPGMRHGALGHRDELVPPDLGAAAGERP